MRVEERGAGSPVWCVVSIPSSNLLYSLTGAHASFVVLIPGHLINGSNFASDSSRSRRNIFLSNFLSDSSLSKLINAVASQSVMLSLY